MGFHRNEELTEYYEYLDLYLHKYQFLHLLAIHHKQSTERILLLVWYSLIVSATNRLTDIKTGDFFIKNLDSNL